MHDYELDRLNTRSFEQLVQALGIAVLGSNLSIFGDGPDGGREASFKGKANYRNLVDWEGYGIVQAKFRQRPSETPRENAKWIIAQLRKEFRAFRPNKKKSKSQAGSARVCPDFYLIATNISLSAVLTKGGKDQVTAELEKYKKSHGLKDFAIWDRDQICRLLDGNGDIRRTYSAWLLPGDVLDAVLKGSIFDSPDFESTLRRYIEAEFLDDQFARLSQGGYTDAKNIPLSSVFVDLPIDLSCDAPSSEIESWIEASLNTGEDSSPDDADIDFNILDEDNDGDGGRRFNFLQVLLEEGRQCLRPSILAGLAGKRSPSRLAPGRIVLVGGPGQGKTTVGQHACQLLRAELVSASSTPLSPEVRQALDRFDLANQESGRALTRRYPLRVDLKQFANALVRSDGDGASNLFDYLTKRLAVRTSTRVAHSDLRRWLGLYPWLLVLDGLDEVPASSNRQQIMQAIRDFISVDAHAADADLLVLATTRPQGYSQEFSPELYRHIHLAPLQANEALRYGTKLATARHPGQQGRISDLASALGRATRNPATVRLMQSPLQVTIMLALIEGGGEPPEQRWKLFHDYYDVIYRREKERATPFSVILSKYEPDIHWIHHRAGWLLQKRNSESGGTNARLSHSEFQVMVNERLQRSGHNSESREKLVKEIHLAATDRLVFLVGNTENEIGFEIRSLQEFMAAEHCFDGGEACVKTTIHAIAPHPYWLNVFLFIAGRVFFQRQELIDSVISVCGQLNDFPMDASLRELRGGSRLAISLLRDGAARNQPASTRTIARCAARALDISDSTVAHMIAGACSSDAEDVFREEIEARAMRADSHQVQAWQVCALLVGLGKRWAQDLMLRHFPWTSESIEPLMTDMSGEKFIVSAELGAKMAQSIFQGTLDQSFWWASRVTGFDPKISSFFSQLWDEIHKAPSEQWPLLVEHGDVRSRVAMHGDQNTRSLADVEFPAVFPKGAHPNWIVASLTSGFARQPSKKQLLANVRVFAELNITSGHIYAWLLPWQFSAVLKLKERGKSWDEIIKLVENGILGEDEDWVRWIEIKAAGLKISQLRTRADWQVDDEHLGLTMQGGGWPVLASAQDTILLAQEITFGLREWPDLSNYCYFETMIDAVCMSLCDLDEQSSVKREVVVRGLVAASLIGGEVIGTPMIAAVILCISDIGERRALLAQCAGKQVRHSWYLRWERRRVIADKRVCEVLDSLRGSADDIEVLKVFSQLPPLAAFSMVRDQDIRALSSQSREANRLSKMLVLNALRWDESSAAEVAGVALELMEVDAHHAHELFEFIDSTGRTDRAIENFVIEVRKLASAAGNRGFASRATTLLAKLVGRRPTVEQMPDPLACS